MDYTLESEIQPPIRCAAIVFYGKTHTKQPERAKTVTTGLPTLVSGTPLSLHPCFPVRAQRMDSPWGYTEIVPSPSLLLLGEAVFPCFSLNLVVGKIALM